MRDRVVRGAEPNDHLEKRFQQMIDRRGHHYAVALEEPAQRRRHADQRQAGRHETDGERRVGVFGIIGYGVCAEQHCEHEHGAYGSEKQSARPENAAFFFFTSLCRRHGDRARKRHGQPGVGKHKQHSVDRIRRGEHFHIVLQHIPQRDLEHHAYDFGYEIRNGNYERFGEKRSRVLFHQV